MFTPKDLEHDFSCKTMSNLFWKINKRKLYMEPAVAYKRLKNFIVWGFFPTSVTKCTVHCLRNLGFLNEHEII